MKNPLWSLIILCVLISCSTDEELLLEDKVDVALITYFESFAQEASIRGVHVDWSQINITASIVTIEDRVAGQCLTYEQGRRHVNIDKEYWLKGNMNEKEFLIFHELGHCILSRSHDDQSDRNGVCLSLMNSGENNCRMNYNQSNRIQYLDELFF